MQVIENMASPAGFEQPCVPVQKKVIGQRRKPRRYADSAAGCLP